jgi:hypothetical protein
MNMELKTIRKKMTNSKNHSVAIAAIVMVISFQTGWNIAFYGKIQSYIDAYF